MAETREESQRKVFTEENQTSAAKENPTGINAEKSQASIPEKQTIVTYTDDELVSNKYICTPFAVLVQGKTWQTNSSRCNFKARSTAASQALLSRNKADDQRKQRQRI